MVAQIGFPVIQKFHLLPTWQCIFQICIFSYKSIQSVNPWKSFDGKSIDLPDQLLLKFLKLSVIAGFLISFPVIQLGKHFLQIGARLFFCKVLIYHMLNTDIDQFVHIAVGVCSVRIAPFAIFLIQRTVFFPP